MSDNMTEIIDQVKQALKAATSGPWKVYEKVYEEDKPYLAERLIGTEYDHPQLKAPDSVVANSVCAFEPHHRVYISKEDAHLIAHAPTWLSSLITTIESLQEKCEEFEERYTDSQFHVKALSDVESVHLQQIESGKEEIEGYKQALKDIRFYANISVFASIEGAQEFRKHIHSLSDKALSSIPEGEK